MNHQEMIDRVKLLLKKNEKSPGFTFEFKVTENSLSEVQLLLDNYKESLKRCGYKQEQTMTKEEQIAEKQLEIAKLQKEIEELKKPKNAGLTMNLANGVFNGYF